MGVSRFLILSGCVGIVSSSLADVLLRGRAIRSAELQSGNISVPANASSKEQRRCNNNECYALSATTTNASYGIVGAMPDPSQKNAARLVPQVGLVPLCVDVQNGIAQPGTNIQVRECSDGDANQAFYSNFSISEGHRIHWARDMSYCIDVDHADFRNGTNVILMKCDDNNKNQLFQYQLENGRFRVHPFWYSDRCFDVAATAGHYGSGSNLQIWSCFNTNANQVFSIERVEVQWLIDLKSLVGQTPLCVDVSGGVPQINTNIQAWECLESGVNQQFIVDVDFRYGQHIRWAHDLSFCLDVDVATAGELKDGANVVLTKCDQSRSLQDFVFWSTSGPSQIRPLRNVGYCLDVAVKDGHYVSGSNLQIWSCFETNANQFFNVTYLSGVW